MRHKIHPAAESGPAGAAGFSPHNADSSSNQQPVTQAEMEPLGAGGSQRRRCALRRGRWEPEGPVCASATHSQPVSSSDLSEMTFHVFKIQN